jgi:hypothetical protein
MDTHRLEMITLGIDDDRTAVRFLSVLTEVILRYPGFAAWTPATFEVFIFDGGGGGIGWGVAGDRTTALVLDPSRTAPRAGSSPRDRRIAGATRPDAALGCQRRLGSRAKEA